MLTTPASMFISLLNYDHRAFKAAPPRLHRPRHRHISPVCRLPSCAKSGSRISKKFFLTIFPGAAHLCSSYHHWLASRGSSSGFPTFQQGCHRLSGKEIWQYSDGVRRYNPGFSFSPLYQKYNCNIFYINGQMGWDAERSIIINMARFVVFSYDYDDGINGTVLCWRLSRS